jgi:hypothetical protein
MSFFKDLEDFAKGFVTTVGGIVDDVASAIARPLGVHPDVVKVAAAALGMYYQAGGFATAAGEAVSEAAAADLVAAHGAEALAVMGDASAAAELAAATGAALPSGIDPAMLASQLAAEGSIASAAHIASAAGVSTAPIVDSLIASGQYDAAVQLTMATNPMELGFVNQNIGLAKTAAETATAFPVATSPLATMGGPNILMDFPANMIDASLGQSYNALGVGAGVPAAAAGANVLSAADLAAISGAEGLAVPAALEGAGANALATGAAFDPASALETQLSTITPGASPADLAWMDTVSPSQLEAISTSALPGATALPFSISELGKLAKDYGVPLSLLASAFMGSRAATNAAETQAQSAREARQLARDIFNEQKALQEPYRAAGITAQNQLLNLLGLSGNTAAAEYGKFARPFGMSDFQADPGYAFRLSEGMKALEASRAARGGLLSGATGKALQRYGQEMGSQEYGTAFNRFQTERANRLNPLAGLMASGQAAAAGQAANAGNYATTAGNLTTSIGAAQAAGQVGMTNALTGALGQYLNYSANQDLANALRRSSYLP